ncbi:MAG: hypothetical protein ACE5EX_06340 [Phycisphaerae bacterium]
MAGEAPQLRPESGRWKQLLLELPDAKLSGYMLLFAALIGALSYLIDLSLFD